MVSNTAVETGSSPATPPRCRYDRYNSIALRFFWLAAALLLIFTFNHLFRAWQTGASLGQSSGIVLGQAIDLADGTFYRPLVSDRGIGGTRYMPLLFVLLAPLIKLGFDPINAGFAIILLTDIALLVGVYVLLRRLRVERALAAPAASLVFAATSGQYAATTIRNDLLPATLNVWGLAFACTLGNDSPKPRPLLAALFFTLAFTAKIVALYGAAAAVLAMLLSAQWKNALKLAAFTFFGMLLSLGIIHWASDGRFLENMQACASGGVNWLAVRKKYLRILIDRGFRHDLVASLFFVLAGLAIFRIRWNRAGHVLLALALLAGVWLFWQHKWHGLISRKYGHLPLPMCTAFLLLVFLLIYRIHWADLRQTPLWALLITAAVTLAMFVSPGIGYNNFLDFHIIAVVFVVLQLARGRLPQLFTTAALAAITLGSVLYFHRNFIDRGMNRQRAEMLLAKIGSADSPFLCKMPILHIYARQAPFILDPWMFRRLPPHLNASKALGDKLEANYFSAVLIDNPQQKFGPVDNIEQFGPEFIKALNTHYAVAQRYKDKRGRDRFLIYRPKAQVSETQPTDIVDPLLDDAGQSEEEFE